MTTLPIPTPSTDHPQTPLPLAPPPASSLILSQLRDLKNRCRHDLRHFAATFFPDHCRLPFSELHDHLFKRRQDKLALPLEERQGITDVVLAPRGAAKSTLVSLVFPAHALLYGHERYIVLISATQRQATLRLAALRSALIQNPHLKTCFPEELQQLTRLSSRSIELGPVRIDAFSAGAELRGISHGRWRPTWIILDDVERSDRVLAARHRDALADWFAQVVDHLGDRSTHIDLIGTLLHRDALPARLGQRPGVVARTFKSIIREADATPLWDQWRARFHDLANPCRARDARAFFHQRAPDMLAGARVLWPQKEDYYGLARLRETHGRAAFDKEKQNAPWADGATVFATFPLRRFRLADGLLLADPAFEPSAVSPVENGVPQIPLADLRCFGFLDPALGGAAGDFAAIATVGLDSAGYLYLLDVWLARAGPSEQVQRAFDLHQRWNYQLFGIEANAFQQLLLDPFEQERARRRAQRRPWDLALEPQRHAGDKNARILSLEPLARAGWLLWNADLPAEFMSQLLDYPGAAHDDGPDAVAAAVKLARDASRPILQPLRRPRSPSGPLGNY